MKKEWVEELRGNDTPEVTPDVNNPYTKLDTTAGVLHKEWVGLTDEEREQVRSSVGYNQFMSAGEYAKAVQLTTEAKLKEKNVPQP